MIYTVLAAIGLFVFVALVGFQLSLASSEKFFNKFMDKFGKRLNLE